MLQCPACGREHPADARYCLQCGAQVSIPVLRPPKHRRAVLIGVAITAVAGAVIIIWLAIPALKAPVLPAARRLVERQRQIHCLYNLRRLGVALQMYMDDYEGFLPPFGRGQYPHWKRTGVVWPLVVEPYVRSRDVFSCLSASPTEREPYSYFFNRRLSGRSIGNLHNPATCIMIGDWVRYGPKTGRGDDDSSTAWDIARSKQAPPDGAWEAGERHLGCGVYVFVDGHVRASVRREEILPGNQAAPPPGGEWKPSFYP